MNKKIRQAQLKVLGIFAAEAKNFALAGGTALELYYLQHRFSVDLDFFAAKYDLKEISRLVLAFGKCFNTEVKMESEFTVAGNARVRFYVLPVKGSIRPLKIDFVEDVFFEHPDIKKTNGVRIYGAENIYFQKIAAISEIKPEIDEIGRLVMQGRMQARDVFDVYMLSKKIKPLHSFLEDIPGYLQRGMIHWYRSFSRQDLKLELLDLDIYNTEFDSKKMILYLENEIREFAKGIAE